MYRIWKKWLRLILGIWFRRQVRLWSDLVMCSSEKLRGRNLIPFFENHDIKYHIYSNTMISLLFLSLVSMLFFSLVIVSNFFCAPYFNCLKHANDCVGIYLHFIVMHIDIAFNYCWVIWHVGYFMRIVYYDCLFMR